MADDRLSFEILARDAFSAAVAKMAASTDKLAGQMKKLNTDARAAGEGLSRAESAAQRAAGGMDRAAAGASRIGEGMSRAGSMATSAGEKMRGMASATASFVGNLAANAVASLASKLAQLGKSIISLGISTAANNQTAAISFEVLLGSAQKAQSFLADMQKFAAATPFDLPTLKDAASRLLAVGVQAKDIIPLMTRLGDATAGMGTGAEGIERAVYALQQMRLAGKVTLEDVNQLQDAGIPALDALAAYTHKTVATIRDEISKGSLKADTMFAAIESGAGPAFGRLKGMMDKQSGTLQGVWSTFKDNVSQTLGKVFEGALPGLTKLVNWAGTALPAAIAKVQEFAGKIKPYVMDIVNMFKGEVAGANFGKNFGSIANDAKKLAETIKANWPQIKEIIGLVGGAILGIVKGILWLIDIVIKIDTVMIGVWSRIMDAVNVAMGVIMGAIFRMLDTVATVAEKLHLPFAKGIRDAANAVQAETQRMQGAINALHGKTITVTIDQSFVQHGQVYNQQVPHFASGGIARGLAVVGEHGPELAYFGSPTRIIPNDQIAPVTRPLGMSAGPSTLTLVVAGDTDSAFATAFQRLLREGKIRVKAA